MWTVALETYTGMTRRHFIRQEDAQEYFDLLVDEGRRPWLIRT